MWMECYAMYSFAQIDVCETHPLFCMWPFRWLVQGRGQIQFFFHMNIYLSQHNLLKSPSFTHCSIMLLLSWNKCPYMHGPVLGPLFCPLAYSSVFVQYHIVLLKIALQWVFIFISTTPLILFNRSLGILDTFHVHLNLRIYFAVSINCDFDWDCIALIDHFGKTWHNVILSNTEFSSSWTWNIPPFISIFFNFSIIFLNCLPKEFTHILLDWFQGFGVFLCYCKLHLFRDFSCLLLLYCDKNDFVHQSWRDQLCLTH